MLLKHIKQNFDKNLICLWTEIYDNGEVKRLLSNINSFHKRCLEVLADRVNGEYPVYFEPELPKKPKGPNRVQIQNMDLEESVKKTMLSIWGVYDREMASYKRDKKTWDLANKAINNQDGVLAWQILESHSDYDDEEIILDFMELE